MADSHDERITFKVDKPLRGFIDATAKGLGIDLSSLLRQLVNTAIPNLIAARSETEIAHLFKFYELLLDKEKTEEISMKVGSVLRDKSRLEEDRGICVNNNTTHMHDVTPALSDSILHLQQILSSGGNGHHKSDKGNDKRLLSVSLLDRTREQALLEKKAVIETNIQLINAAFAYLSRRFMFTGNGDFGLGVTDTNTNSNNNANTNGMILVERDALARRIVQEGQSLNLKGFERLVDVNANKVETDYSLSKAYHILQSTIKDYSILEEIQERESDGKITTLYRRPRLKRSYELAQVIAAERTILDDIESKLDRAKHNKIGVTKTNILMEKAAAGRLRYYHATEQFCPPVLASLNCQYDDDKQKSKSITIAEQEFLSATTISSIGNSGYRIVAVDKSVVADETALRSKDMEGDYSASFYIERIARISELPIRYSNVEIRNNSAVAQYWKRLNHSVSEEVRRQVKALPYCPYVIPEMNGDFSGLRIGPPCPFLLPCLYDVEFASKQYRELELEQQKKQKRENEGEGEGQCLIVTKTVGASITFVWTREGSDGGFTAEERELEALLHNAQIEFTGSLAKHNPHLLIAQPELVMSSEEKRRYFEQRARDSSEILEDDFDRMEGDVI
jgi:hypothetical protein